MPPEQLEDAGQGSDVVKELPIVADTVVVSDPPPNRDDVDDLDLEALRDAAKAEEAGGTAAEAQPETQAPAGEVAPSPDQDQQPPERPKPIMIPKERFDVVNQRAQALERELAQERGKNIALESRIPPPAPVVPPRITEIDQSVRDLAKKFDAGEITFADWQAQQQTLQNERDQVREADLLAKVNHRTVQPAAPQPSNDDLYLADKTNEIQTRYGQFIDAIPAPYFDNVVSQARAELEAEGVAMRGTKATYLLRERIGVIAQEQGPSLVAAYQRSQARLTGQPPAAAPPAQRGTEQPPAPRAGPTPEQRLAKLNMQAEMPPNIGSMTRSQDLNEVPNEADLDGMSDEDISALPQGVRNKLLGITS